MRTRSLPLLTLLLVAVLLAGCGGESASVKYGLTDWPDKAATGAETGERAPNFKLATHTGGEVTLDGLSGKPVVLNFFASWCQNCREEMAALQAISAEGTQVLGIDLRENADTVAGLASDTGATFTLSLDKTGEVTRAYKVVNLPATVIIDGSGTIRTVIRGPVDEQTVRDALAGL